MNLSAARARSLPLEAWPDAPRGDAEAPNHLHRPVSTRRRSPAMPCATSLPGGVRGHDHAGQ
jgi:hypothetical protein